MVEKWREEQKVMTVNKRVDGVLLLGKLRKGASQ